ncbi:MAG TPA: hypothetical protein EYQ50_13985 [Verrucomicrobiales bacterium]|nr:hypothetical protein [Verrucomicrobiales bacterium]
MKHLGGGVVLFPNIIEVPPYVIEELSKQTTVAFDIMYEFTYDDDGEILYGVNLSGHTIRGEDLYSDPIRITGPGVVINPEFFGACDKAIYQKLLSYFTLFPDAFPCIWWEIGGHVAYYPTGSKYGLHCDNDVNYIHGDFPQDQSALNQVLSCSLVLNNDFVGGTMGFKYLDLDVHLAAGDLLMFPSNFMATHEVKEVTEGQRYSYLCNFAQGSPAPDRNVVIDKFRNPGGQGKAWLPTLDDDFRKHITECLPGDADWSTGVLSRLPDHGRTTN